MVKDNKTISKFWIAFFIVLSMLFLGLGIWTYVNLSNELAHKKATVVEDENFYRVRVENAYQQALYTSSEDLKSIEAIIGKICVSNDKVKQTELLVELSMQSASLNTSVSDLPLNAGEALTATESFTNKMGSYSRSLIAKLAEGKDLTFTDKTALASLATTTKGLQKSFLELLNGEGLYITNSLFSDGANQLGDGFDEIDDNIFKYESLTFEGPFSDSAKEKEIKSQGTLEEKDAKERIKKLFNDEEVYSIESDGTLKNKGVCYIYKVETDKGTVRVLLTSGGDVVEYTTFSECKEGAMEVIDGDNAKNIAEKFANQLGFPVKAISVSKTINGILYVNLVSVVDDVIIYPDSVKVGVCSYSGDVVALESRSYLANHQDRDLAGFAGPDTKTDSNFLNNSDKGMLLLSTKKAIVEKYGKEYKCIQYECENMGSKYLVYVDIETGREVQIYKVVNEKEGFSLI